MQLNLSNKNMLWGAVLIAAGASFLLQVTGIFGVLTGLFWSIAFAAVAANFLYVFFTDIHGRWWAAIPGFTLMGLAATVFYGNFRLPFMADIGGPVFLGSIGLGFLAVFFTNRHMWWAIIPGGAMLSVAGVAFVGQTGFGFLNPASVLFIGLGLTFAVLGLLSTYLNVNLRWAYIPAAILLVMGLVIFTPFVGALAFVWPLALIAGGAYLILRRPKLSLPAVVSPAAPATVNMPGAPATVTQSAAAPTTAAQSADVLEPATAHVSQN
jgi:hypothetical protein